MNEGPYAWLMNFQQFFIQWKKSQLFYIVQLNRVELDDRMNLINHGSTSKLRGKRHEKRFDITK